MEVNLLIKNVNVFNCYLKRFIKENVAVLEDKFLYVGGNAHDMRELSPKEVIDGEGKFLIPGLIDIHMHIESSMTTPFQFSQAVIPHGVTTVVADPHEIANVLGMEGIKAFIEDSKNTIIDIFYGIPSSVPSTSATLETTGGRIKEEEVYELLHYNEVKCLGEVMNFVDLIGDENSTINKIISLVKEKRPELLIEGHCPKIEGLNLAKYIYKGVDGDHTQQSPKSLEEKIKNGMFIEIQEKSMSEENIKYLMDNNLYEHFALVTDDVMADKIIDGHLNRLVKNAIIRGLSPEMAIYTSTFTPARRMGLKDRGAIAPGKIADFILLNNLEEFKVEKVYKNGKLTYNGKLHLKENINFYPEKFYNTVCLEKLKKEDFDIKTPIKQGDIKCRVIEVKDGSTFTEEKEETLKVRDGKLLWEGFPYCLIGVFERYGKNGNRTFGLVKGDIIKEGAVATTWAHDHHNLMVMGKNLEDMIVAANWVIENSGGYSTAKNGEVLSGVELKIGGIVSDERIDILGGKLKKLREALRELGYNHHNEIMSFSTLSLPVSPSIKITDKGLIRVKTGEILSLFTE
ncbi:adenine deaminase C-terminal domain-containing protein [Clostridium malenominatum]|uniref:Adenine deaminase n=1 Tax=Clostridium malenominatum TaxID=1539 RepID=A0ABP3UCI0_9CLOT